MSNAGLQLKVLTNSCGANQVQDFFQVINTGTTAVKLSDISIKLWADDTSGQTIVPHLSTGGCVTGVNGNPSCVHPVTGVTTTATPFSPACGPDPTHKANWEIKISDTDATTVPPGAMWSNIQSALNLANFTNFTPGTVNWYSSCVPGTGYTAAAHFAVYFQGNLVFSNGVTAPDCRAPHGQQQLSGYLAPLPSAPILGSVAPSTVVHLSIGLPPRNQPTLQTFIKQVSDPTNSNYGHYLTLANFTAMYGPTSTSYQALVSWARSKNLTVTTYPNNMSADIAGTAAQIEQALFLNLFTASRPDGSHFYEADRQPSLDLAASVASVEWIDGLDSYVLPQLAFDSGSGQPACGSGPLFESSDLRNAYLGVATNCSGLTGSNQSIGIVAFDGFVPGDVTVYESLTHLTNVPAVQIVSVNNDIPPAPAAPLPASGGLGSQEVAGDIEMAIAMAPAAQIVVVEGTLLDSILSALVSNPTISQISSSWIRPTDSRSQHLFDELAAQGQSFFQASGDFGAYQPLPAEVTCPPDDLANISKGLASATPAPATPTAGSPMGAIVAAQNVIVVGGTDLTMNSPGVSYFSERGQGFSGGGISPTLDLPAFQTGLATTSNQASSTHRNFPDVSMVAADLLIVGSSCGASICNGGANPSCTQDADCPGSVCTTFQNAKVCAQCPADKIISGQARFQSGTSLAAPLWAGFTALMNQSRASAGFPLVGYANPLFYQIGQSPAYQNSFNDITTGGPNTNGCGLGFSVVPGYDLVTGWGSPKCGLMSPPRPLAISMGRGLPNTCEVRSGGAVFCWGDNTLGQVGDGTTNPRPSPVSVAGLSTGAIAVAVGEQGHVCAAKSDGTVTCWGANNQGQLGDGTTNSQTKPTTAVVGLTGVKALAAGAGFNCALRTDGTVWCWGLNDLGQLGNGTTANQLQPVQVVGLAGATAIDAGGKHVCAVLSSGGMSCWGDNAFGQLGDGTTNPHSSPVSVLNIGSTGVATSVVTGKEHTCAIVAATTPQPVFQNVVGCWGNNASGQLGNNLNSFESTPTAIVDSSVPPAFLVLGNVASLSAGSIHTCGVLQDGAMFCWGDNSFGELGNGAVGPVLNNTGFFILGAGFVAPGFPNPCDDFQTGAPGGGCRQILGGLPLAVWAGEDDTCSLLAIGTIQCWGDNAEGQLGDATTATRLDPVTIPF